MDGWHQSYMRENWKSKRSRIQVERGHCKFERSLECSVWNCESSMTWWTARYWLLTTMSSGCFSWCRFLILWKSKSTKTQSEVSNAYQIRWCKLLDNYLSQDLPENEPTTISTTKMCTTRWRTQLRRQILKQRRGPSYGDKFQCGGERIDSYPPISLTHIL